MAADDVTPLATVSDVDATPYSDLLTRLDATYQSALMVRATRQIESVCDRRLAPFTGLVESHRLVDSDVEDAVSAALPLPNQAQINVDYARALGYPLLVRHFWLEQYPAKYPDLWSGAVTACTIKWSYGEVLTVDLTTLQYENDTGHGRFLLGTFVPPGSVGVFTYSGGYATVPADLQEACIVQAALFAMHSLEPQARPEINTGDLREHLDDLIAPYTRET